MKIGKENISTLVTGASFVVLGLLLLATFIDWVNSVSIYKTVLPLLIMLAGGYITFIEDGDQRKKVGLALLVVGFVVLLVRFEFLNGRVVNAILGAILLISGTYIVSHKMNGNGQEKES